IVLIILDGWGINPRAEGNAIALARTPHFDVLWNAYPHTQLAAAGSAVGLSDGKGGNSEVGHLTIGAGRVVEQEARRIDRAIADGTFFANDVLKAALRHVKDRGYRLHLIGLVSDGGVHSLEQHTFALVQMAAREGLQAEQVLVHAILDGVDSPPQSAQKYVARLMAHMLRVGVGSVASLCGRSWAMEHRGRWERTQQVYDLLTQGKGLLAPTAIEGIERAYQRGEMDAHIAPTVVLGSDGLPRGTVRDGDAVICFNLRGEHVSQLLWAFVADEFKPFVRQARPKPHIVALTECDLPVAIPVAFPSLPVPNCLGEVLSRHKKKQLRLAESERELAVSRFFNGRRREPLPDEERIIVPSDAAYPPAMKAAVLAQQCEEAIASRRYDFVLVNFANADVVGRTGNIAAVIQAVEAVDNALGQVVEATLQVGGLAVLTASHGGAEQMVESVALQPGARHTTNPVPFILVGATYKGRKLSLRRGGLADVAPTVLSLMHLPVPDAMTGVDLRDVTGEEFTPVEESSTIEDEVRAAIELGYRMELDACRFYLMAAESTPDERGKALYRRLAADEEHHAAAAQEQFRLVLAEAGAALTLVHETVGEHRVLPNTSLSPVEILETAIQGEVMARDLFRECAAKARHPEARQIFEEMVQEEEEHLQRLLDARREAVKWGAYYEVPDKIH
ncbi:MAG: 2,3-bisphosphoglycerate-independent phosphoglycerate mutase, partial [Abditibacteriales bacterium]|nr:2,3-bisphosphoglycerate-independent phosphoglycerate mutase [Abditibacteriales bacterium]MDW8364607.1 2,3-bisphosphoglycerate-independent phosphoglycerate mutase [Abditibacteriales bacterium]